MSGLIEQRLQTLGLTLPIPAQAVANYLPAVISGTLLFVSGQLPMENGTLAVKGHLGDTVNLDEGTRAAHLCGLNLLAQVRAACDGNLDRVRRVVRLTGYVASTAQFIDQPKVMNGASDLMVVVFGEAGRHARVAVAAPSLPLGAAVEIDGIFEIV